MKTKTLTNGILTLMTIIFGLTLTLNASNPNKNFDGKPIFTNTDSLYTMWVYKNKVIIENEDSEVITHQFQKNEEFWYVIDGEQFVDFVYINNAEPVTLTHSLKTRTIQLIANDYHENYEFEKAIKYYEEYVLLAECEIPNKKLRKLVIDSVKLKIQQCKNAIEGNFTKKNVVVIE